MQLSTAAGYPIVPIQKISLGACDGIGDFTSCSGQEWLIWGDR